MSSLQSMLQGTKPKIVIPPPFTNEEIHFIITKLRGAEYKGIEFELFYEVMIKLEREIQK